MRRLTPLLSAAVLALLLGPAAAAAQSLPRPLPSDAKPHPTLKPVSTVEPVEAPAPPPSSLLPTQASPQQPERPDLSILPLEPVDDVALVTIVDDPLGIVGGEPIRLTTDEGGEAMLSDDGSAPDAEAGDGIYTGALAELTGNELTLTTSDGRQLWSDSLYFHGGQGGHRLSIQLQLPRVFVELAPLVTEAMVDIPPPPPTDAPGPVDRPPPNGQPPARAPLQFTQADKAALTWFALGLTGGLLMALLVPWLQGRAGRAPTIPVGEPMPAPSSGLLRTVPLVSQTWVVPDLEAMQASTIALAKYFAQWGEVLLVPRNEQLDTYREALIGCMTVRRPDRLKPEPARVLQLARRSARKSPLLVLVEGAEALEEPLEDELPDAVVQELFRREVKGATVLVLTLPSQLERVTPSAVLEWAEGGLVDGSGQLILEGDPTGLSLPREAL